MTKTLNYDISDIEKRQLHKNQELTEIKISLALFCLDDKVTSFSEKTAHSCVPFVLAERQGSVCYASTLLDDRRAVPVSHLVAKKQPL